MKLKYVQYLLFIGTVAIGCSSNRQTNDDMPFIDVRKTYPEKELNITDFADVSYVHLNTLDDAYLYKGRILCVTTNTLVVCDQISSSILFFSRDGQPRSRFNRYGQGPEEHRGVNRILYDEKTDDVFVCEDLYSHANYIQVYSSTGEYKRKITLPQNSALSFLVSFDDQSLFVYAEDYHFSFLTMSRTQNSKTDIPHTTYYRISKTNGEILDSLKLISDEIELDVILSSSPSKRIVMTPDYCRLTKGVTGFYLFNPETDTVFHYAGDKSLTPVLYKIPSVRYQDPKYVLSNIVYAGRYQFFMVEPLGGHASTWKYYFLDKETGEIFRQKLTLPDFKGKEFKISAGLYMLDTGDVNGYIYELGLYELKEAYRENKLSGKLKELVATLNEDTDNNVFVLVEYK